MGDELLQEVGERGARPGDPAVGLEEAALALAREQRVAVVELADEVELLARGLDGVEHPEARAGHPRGHGRAGKRAYGEDVGERASATSSGMPSGMAAAVSTGLPKVMRLARPSPRRSAAAW